MPVLRVLWAGLLLLLALTAPLQTYAETEAEAETGTEVVAAEKSHAPGESVIVRLHPATTRKRADVAAVVARIRALPGLEGVDVRVAKRDVLLLNLTIDQEPMKVKDALLGDADVYEVEVGASTYRREGHDVAHADLKAQVKQQARETVKDKIKTKLTDRIKEWIQRLRGKGKDKERAAAAIKAGARKRRAKPDGGKRRPAVGGREAGAGGAEGGAVAARRKGKKRAAEEF